MKKRQPLSVARFSIAQVMLVGAYFGLMALFIVRLRKYIESLSQPQLIDGSSGTLTRAAGFPFGLALAGAGLLIWLLIWVWTCFKAWRLQNKAVP